MAFALSRMTSHFFKCGPFPPNEVGRVTLPALQAKPIRPSQKSVLKNLRSGIRRSWNLGSTPPGHSSKIQLLRACWLKYYTVQQCLSTGIGYVVAPGFTYSSLHHHPMYNTLPLQKQYTYNNPNLTSFNTQIQIHIIWSDQEVRESKIDHTNAIYLQSAEPEAHNSALSWH